MTRAIVYIPKDDGGYRGYYIGANGSPNCLGRYLLECSDDNQLNNLMSELASDSFDAEEMESPYNESNNYVRINKIWYVFNSSDNLLQSVEDAIKEQLEYIDSYCQKPKVHLVRNSYFESINDEEHEEEMSSGSATAYASYSTSAEDGYKMIMVRSWLEPDEVADFTSTMKKAEVKSFAYPFANFDEVTPIFSKSGYIRNGFYKHKCGKGRYSYTPKFTYYSDESIDE